MREKLILRGKVSGYILYSAGEISLVVIGILIALQVNNWNEARKDRAFEVKMLNEVHKALLSYRQHFHTMMEGMMELDQTTDFVANYIAQGKPMHDSIRNRIWQLNYGISMQYNSGPYSAIKASGIDKIQRHLEKPVDQFL